MLHELFDPRIIQRALPHLLNQFSHDHSGLLGELIPPLSLPLIEFVELLMEDPLGQIRFDLGDPFSGKKAGPAVRAVTDHVDVRVMALVVKRRVPPELLPRYLRGLRHLHGIAGEKPLPLSRVIVAEPRRVLPSQGDDGEPHIAGVMGHLVRNIGQHQRIIRPGEQGVRSGALCAGAAGNVADVVVPLGDLVVVVLQCAGDELGGIAAGRSGLVVLILKHSTAQREIPKEPRHHLPLFLRGGELFMPYRHALGALSGVHVADVVLQMGGGALRSALEIGALEYDAGHGASPSSSQPMVGPLIPIDISDSSGFP